MNKTSLPATRRTGGSAESRSKLFYRIQEVAEITGVKPYILRYWEREFRQLSPQKDKNDQRRYRRPDIDLILDIKDLLYAQKFTIAGARKRIRAQRSKGNGKRSPDASTHRSTLRGIRAELHDLMNLLKV
ncbi:MerR family transcriptional regulator [Candidatus Sumerlaeota bacterium]|nr:MerR family transcriptional regulator [Candidatus Sumerlaeota bacterium]